MAEVKDFKIVKEIPLNAGMNETMLIQIIRDLEFIKKEIKEIKEMAARNVV